MHDLHSSLLKIPDVLSTSSDNEVDINLKLSINLSLYVIVLLLLLLLLLLLHSFLIYTEKVIHFFHIIPNTVKFTFKFYC